LEDLVEQAVELNLLSEVLDCELADLLLIEGWLLVDESWVLV
jgi:hypothetical protein